MTMLPEKLDIPEDVKPALEAVLRDGSYHSTAEFIRHAVRLVQEQQQTSKTRAAARLKAIDAKLEEAGKATEQEREEERRSFEEVQAAMAETRRALYPDLVDDE